MIDFLLEFALFFLKSLTIVVAVGAIVLTIFSASKGDGGQHGIARRLGHRRSRRLIAPRGRARSREDHRIRKTQFTRSHRNRPGAGRGRRRNRARAHDLGGLHPGATLSQQRVSGRRRHNRREPHAGTRRR